MVSLSANFLFEGFIAFQVGALKVKWTSSFAAPVGTWTNTIMAVVVENASFIRKRNNGHTHVVWSVERLTTSPTVILVSFHFSYFNLRVW